MTNETVNYSVSRSQLISHLELQIKDKKVLAVMAKVPRELFVPEESRIFAYEDRPLPIGMQQTISQPYIVAIMTSALGLTGSEKVLEIGTGSGYQTAILAELVNYVVSIERILPLSQKANKLLNMLGYSNVEFHEAGATLGWPQSAPYDAIIVAAGAPKIPESLLSQLKLYGRMVIPVGSRYDQELIKVTRLANNNEFEYLGGCRFVPLIDREAWDEV